MTPAKPAPLRIVHIVVAGDIGGAERLLIDIATRPEATGADHIVALMTPNPKLRETFVAAGLRIRDRGPVSLDPLAYLWRAFGPAEVAWLERVLRDEAADIVHVHTYASHIPGVRAARRLGLPVIRTEHGIQHYTDPSCAPYRGWALRNTDRVVAVSDYVRRFVVRRAPWAEPKFETVRNGVDTTHFRPAPARPNGPFTFAVVCRLEPWKRIDLVIRAAAQAPEIHLRIAGDGSARAALERLSRALGVGGRVAFLGYRPDPRPVFADAHAAINFSRDEPLGLSVLEAMATQRPVLAHAGGGVPEILRDGETGWLVSESGAAALSARMQEAGRSIARAADLGRAARLFVERDCGIDAMCAAYGRVYAELAGRKPAARGPADGRWRALDGNGIQGLKA